MAFPTRLLLAGVILAISVLAGHERPGAEEPAPTTPELLDAALADEVISADEWTVLGLLWLLDPGANRAIHRGRA